VPNLRLPKKLFIRVNWKCRLDQRHEPTTAPSLLGLDRAAEIDFQPIARVAHGRRLRILSDTGSRTYVLVAGLAFLVVADLVLAFSSSVVGVMLGVALWGMHMGLTQGLFSALVADTAPEELRGTAFGMFNLLTGLALLAASVLAGALWEWIGPRATFLAGAGFTAVALAAFALISRRTLLQSRRTV
jgi:MFS family permease